MVSGPDTSKLPSRRIAGFNLGIQFSFLLERDNELRSIRDFTTPVKCSKVCPEDADKIVS